MRRPLLRARLPVEQFEAQPADSRADIEHDAPDRTGAHEQVAKQTGGRPGPFCDSLPIALRDLLIEMPPATFP